MSLVLNGDTGVTTPSGAVVNAALTRGTLVSASGTSVDITGIPSWVKRVTVFLNGVSTSGTSGVIVQIGAGSVQTSGYAGTVQLIQSGGAQTTTASTTSSFAVDGLYGATWTPAASVRVTSMVLTNYSGNIWICSSQTSRTDANVAYASSGVVTLSGTLDRVRMTTSNGTDTFDAGSINILYE